MNVSGDDGNAAYDSRVILYAPTNCRMFTRLFFVAAWCRLPPAVAAAQATVDRCPPESHHERNPPATRCRRRHCRHRLEMRGIAHQRTCHDDGHQRGGDRERSRPERDGPDRLVPGVNTSGRPHATSTSTRAAATGTLSDSMLVLLDGRSVYQDFFGFVMWDFLPVDP